MAEPRRGDAPLTLAALGVLGVTWFTVIAITVDLGGLANLEPGAYVAVVASALPLIGALGLPGRPRPDRTAAPASGSPCAA